MGLGNTGADRMTDDFKTLVLEYLKQMQASADRIERKLDDMTCRLSTMESQLEMALAHIAKGQADIV